MSIRAMSLIAKHVTVRGSSAADFDYATAARRSWTDHTEVSKLVLGWAVEGGLDPSTAVSNTYEVEWPPIQASSGHSPRSTASNGSISKRHAVG